MKTFLLPGLALLVAMPCSATAEAQERPDMPGYGEERPGMPDALPPPVRNSVGSIASSRVSAFSAWSRQRGNPRILLFWNTAFSDETSTRSRVVMRDSSVTTARRNTVTHAREATIEDERTTGGKASYLDPEEEAALEDGFVAAFTEAQANLIDRAAVMRRASVRQDRSDRLDQQYMEALALEQGIDYLVEVLPDLAARNETGMRFTVKILHVPSSRVVARFSSAGRPERGPERLVARAGGFRRERDENLSSRSIGRALAVEAMQAFK